jgi:hypothetical protein
MFVVKVNGRPKSVLTSYQHAAHFADMIRGKGKRITITPLPPDELDAILRTLAVIHTPKPQPEPVDSGSDSSAQESGAMTLYASGFTTADA